MYLVLAYHKDVGWLVFKFNILQDALYWFASLKTVNYFLEIRITKELKFDYRN